MHVTSCNMGNCAFIWSPFTFVIPTKGVDNQKNLVQFFSLLSCIGFSYPIWWAPHRDSLVNGWIVVFCHKGLGILQPYHRKMIHIYKTWPQRSNYTLKFVGSCWTNHTTWICFKKTSFGWPILSLRATLLHPKNPSFNMRLSWLEPITLGLIPIVGSNFDHFI